MHACVCICVCVCVCRGRGRGHEECGRTILNGETCLDSGVVLLGTYVPQTFELLKDGDRGSYSYFLDH